MIMRSCSLNEAGDGKIVADPREFLLLLRASTMAQSFERGSFMSIGSLERSSVMSMGSPMCSRTLLKYELTSRKRVDRAGI